jgi:hypothetical protein
LPVWYRKPDEHQWHTGTTQSISISGAIIHADEPITPADPIVIAISLPVVPGCLVGRGRIVRTVANTSETSGNTFIVAVDRYRISRRDVVLSSPKR